MASRPLPLALLGILRIACCYRFAYLGAHSGFGVCLLAAIFLLTDFDTSQ
jgi:hypothetical protein